MRLEYDDHAAALVRALEDAANTRDAAKTRTETANVVRSQLRLDRALVALLRVHAADAIVPELLRDPGIWNPASRDGITVYVDGGQQTIMTGEGYLSLWDTILAIRRRADDEGAPAITEWHVIRELVDSRGLDLANMQIRTAVLQRRLEEALDIRQPTDDELARAWCFCDTSFFLESKRLFRDVSWGTEVGLNKPVVLMIPPAIMDELDDCRFNERRPRQQKRARAVVRAMDELTVGRAHGEPATVNTKGVELIRLGWEPRAAALGLTNTLADDRLVSSALEYRWRRPGLDVVLSEDPPRKTICSVLIGTGRMGSGESAQRPRMR